MTKQMHRVGITQANAAWTSGTLSVTSAGQRFTDQGRQQSPVRRTRTTAPSLQATLRVWAEEPPRPEKRAGSSDTCEDELQPSGLPPVRSAGLASTGKTMWPPAGVSIFAAVAAIPLGDLPSSYTALPVHPYRQSVSTITRTP